MKILVYPHEILKSRAVPVRRLDGAIKRLADEMLKTMYKAEGIGLAANQVGELVRLVVIDIQRPPEEGGTDGPLVLVNPVIVAGDGEEVAEEGCLSVPGYGAPLKRFSEVEVSCYDLDGKELRFGAGGLLARCIQHEIDHLDGICFVDRLNPVKRALFRKKWAKILARLEEEANDR